MHLVHAGWQLVCWGTRQFACILPRHWLAALVGTAQQGCLYTRFQVLLPVYQGCDTCNSYLLHSLDWWALRHQGSLLGKC